MSETDAARATRVDRARLRPDAVPPAVRAALGVLRDAGHEAWLVGGCVRDLACGLPVADFDATTSAAPEAVLGLFPRAVPIGLRHGTVMIPTHAGPFDVTQYRAGPSLADDLARRDFTVDAVAWDPLGGALFDPHDGLGDLARGVLRAVGDAAARLAEDPLRALRAARIAAALDLTPDAAIEPAMAAVRERLRGVARERIRHELAALALAPHAARGIAMLRRTGIEADLLPGATEDAGPLVEALPPDLALRMAAWLRRTHAERSLTRLRFPKRIVLAAARLVALHPIDARPLRGDGDVRRLLRRAGADGVEALLRLREAERGEPLAELRARIAEVVARDAAAGGRMPLAIDGAGVMRALGTGPGPWVGEALRHLEEAVLDDPASNTPAALAARLHEWAARRTVPPAETGPGRKE